MAGPTGPIIYPPGQYTHCVDRAAYKTEPGFLDAGFAAIAEFALCEYLLGGKLVCLAGGGDACAIGTVIGIEEVGYQKSGFDAIDNDFSFNILPLPYSISDFAKLPKNRAVREPHALRDSVVKHSPLGWLLVDPAPPPPSLPTPREPAGTSPVDGYGVLYRGDETGFTYDHEFQNNLNKLWAAYPVDGSAAGLPIIHCECEGSRIYFVCQALKPFLEIMQGKVPGSPGPSPGDVCRATLGWLPFGIGKAICAIIEHIVAAAIGLALAPAMAAAFAAAWEAAQIYDDLAVTGPVARQIHLNRAYIVLGRWTWDAGHAGHTELHPVKAIQQVELPDGLAGGNDPRQPLDPAVQQRVSDLYDRWCRHLQAAPPPPDIRFPGLRGLSAPQIDALTPAQNDIYVHQQQPENSWVLHPGIDNCLPGDDR